MEVSKFYATKSFQNGSVLVDPISLLPVVPHKAAAEVSRIGHYRRDWLLWVTDDRAKTLMDRTVQVSRWLIDELTNWLID